MKRSISKSVKQENKDLSIAETRESQPSRTRRAHRETKVNESNINLINCHSCKTVDSALNMITCSRLECRESFCINCIKKTYVKFNPSFFLILKEKEAANR